MTATRNVLIAGIGGAPLGAYGHVSFGPAFCRRLDTTAIMRGGEAPTALFARAA
jgi:hypothetical protein